MFGWHFYQVYIKLVFKKAIRERQGGCKKMAFGVTWITVPKK